MLRFLRRPASLSARRDAALRPFHSERGRVEHISVKRHESTRFCVFPSAGRLPVGGTKRSFQEGNEDDPNIWEADRAPLTLLRSGFPQKRSAGSRG